MTAIVFDANVVGAAAVALVEAVGHLGGEGAEAVGGEFVDLAFVFGGSILKRVSDGGWGFMVRFENMM